MPPATVVIVHLTIPNSQDLLSASLREAGYDVVAFLDSMSGIEALEHPKRIELLITRVRFPAGTPNGAALARMARVKRPGFPSRVSSIATDID